MGSSPASLEGLNPSRAEAPGIGAKLRPTRRAEKRLLILFLVLMDAVAAAAAYRAAFMIRFQLELPIFQLDVIPSLAYYEKIVLFAIPVWIFVYAAVGMYNHENLLGGAEEYSLVFRGTIYGLVLVIVASFLVPSLLVARGWLLIAWFLTFLFIALGRFLIRRLVYSLRPRGFFLASAVIVGANNEGRLLAEQLGSATASGLRLVGLIDDDLPAGSMVGSGFKILGSFDDIEAILAREQVEELIVSTSAVPRERRLWLFQCFGVTDGLHLRMSSGLYEIVTTGLHVREFAFVPLVGVNKARLTGLDRILKHALDYLVTVPLLVILSPLLLLIALAVALDSPGSVIHRRRVLGVNGRNFDALKIRTMYIDGDELLLSQPRLQADLAEKHKLKQDPRVTRVGKWLRKLSLDELPQLINVLAGQMSLVGPRMISPEEMQNYDKWGINLLTVRPGITGLWQVSGRSDVTYEERVRLDMHYIRNWTIWLDLRLLWQTIPVVISGRGAY